MTFTQNDWFILVLPMLSGLGSSLFHPEAACLVDAISGTQKGKAMGTFFLGSHACFTVGSMAAGKRKQPKDTARPQNNWNAFGKLSFIIFARSIDLTILNFFIPIYWISVPGRLQIAAALPFQGSCHDLWGQYPSKSDRAYRGHADVLSRHDPCPLFFTNSTTQMTATLLHCSWYRRLFPFCAL